MTTKELIVFALTSAFIGAAFALIIVEHINKVQ